MKYCLVHGDVSKIEGLFRFLDVQKIFQVLSSLPSSFHPGAIMVT
jgi:hypothetical protein